ncbi:hypothetical protein IVA80_15480 [Bradyrhizobium sp. 139]|uniref:hypothetical protein n=1 Tax=Bradyrhizobium sp. 139 TaxID=2782616 RepID=UPI001FFA36D6|nr:hypothetical protein [Bradyrhizobium sp. 139]MCK1742226.1 hypothetical protein [Bradyrhizobium sp. 139]
MPTIFPAPTEQKMTFPAFWTRFLIFVSFAKAAVAGAGLALAALGALDVAFAITARDFLDHMRPHVLDYAAISGGILGAIAKGIFFR